MKDLAKLIRTLAWLTFAAAIYQELRRPPEARTWNGKVAGVVPYDFRVPTIDRLREAYWDPENDQVFSEKVFGVGWAVNLYQARRLLQAGFDRLMGAPPPLSIRMSSREPMATGSSRSRRKRE